MRSTYGDPVHVVRVSGAAGAAAELLVAEGFDHDGVGEGSYCRRERWSVTIFVAVEVEGGLVYIPVRLESSGFMSKTSIPCIFPSSSNRSSPVACSRSVGTVPGAAPGGRRSSIVLTAGRVLVDACGRGWVTDSRI